MPIKLLQHKSYHPYKAENVARVERDKAKARADEEESDRRQTLAESEARLDRLRGKRPQRRGDDVDRAQADVPPRGRPLDQGQGQGQGEQREHLNFWKEHEAAAAPPTVAGDTRSTRGGPNPAADPTKMFLSGASNGWYATPDLMTEAERGATVEANLERAYKDGRAKQRSDPLSQIQRALKEREHSKNKSQPPQPNRPTHGSRTCSTSTAPGWSEAAERESSERDRAKALLLKKKRESSSAAETDSTVTSLSYQRDLYNPVQTGWAQSARRGGGGGGGGVGGWVDRKRERDSRHNSRY